MSVASSKAKLAGLIAHRDPADPDIEAARAQLAEANAEAAITRLQLPVEARARLARLLLGGDSDAA